MNQLITLDIFKVGSSQIDDRLNFPLRQFNYYFFIIKAFGNYYTRNLQVPDFNITVHQNFI